jgi:PDZ domain-containing secreted protein/Zn-dependent protease
VESNLTLFKVRGIPIGITWSWLLVFGLVVWSLSQAMFPVTYPGFSGTTYLFMGLAAAALFFASVLLHELGHALRALKEGLPIRGITLWLFGGVAQLAGSPPSPRVEFHVAICGPVVSLVLAAGFLGGAWIGDHLAWPGTVQGVVDYLGRINLIVLAFNLVPALPLDGGRVLRAWLWRRQRSFTAATRSAARVGQAFGWMLVAIGVAGLFGGAGGSGFGGLWMAVIGWFLIQAARGEADQALLRRALGDLRVRDVMRPLPAGGGASRAADAGAVQPEQLVYDAAGAFSQGHGSVAVLEDGRPVGQLTADDVNAVLERELANPREEKGARGAGVVVWVVVGAIIAIAASALYRPPYVVVAPGAAIDVSHDIHIDGAPVDELNGRYLITAVSVSRRSALATVWSALRGDREVVPLSEFSPPGVPPAEYARIQRQAFQESRRIAAAAAAAAVGLPVKVTGTGARVVDVVDKSPAQGRLLPGDVLIEVDGKTINTSADVMEAVRARPAGAELSAVIERDNARRTVRLRSEELPDMAGRAAIGVLLETRGLDIDLPFEVRFEERDIGGPSAGLAYALAVADLLDDGDFARGRTVAATGTISLDGDVGPVGGVEQKAIAADDAGADLFLVPERDIGRAHGEAVPVRGVDRLGEALDFLRLG